MLGLRAVCFVVSGFGCLAVARDAQGILELRVKEVVGGFGLGRFRD